MKLITRSQVIALLSRSQDPEDPRFIDRNTFQAFLEGRMVLREDALGGRIIELTERIEQLIQLGYHKAAGMSASAYRKLWPKTVTQPAAYAGRFDEPLLVDLTIAPEKLFKLNSVRDGYFYVEPAECEDLVDAPIHSEHGKALTRYVAFCQTGSRYLGKSVREARKSLEADEVGMVTREALHLSGQYEQVLRNRAVECLGSAIHAADVYWFGHREPRLGAGVVDVPDGRCGGGSRGIRVVPISW